MFAPSRLRLARLRLGSTRTKLAFDSGISLRTLTEYENAERPPSEENLAKLAGALAVRRRFFDLEPIEPVATSAASFRKLSKASATRRDAVLASAALTLEFYQSVERRFRLPHSDIPTFDKLTPEHAAELTRRRWNLGDRPISNMVHLLESKGVRLASLHTKYSDIDAFCFHRDAVPYVFVNTSKSAERQRFDLAHELGHLVLHGEVDMDPSTSRDREHQANQFAANFLMPAVAIRGQQLTGASIQRVLAARLFWRVSAMAMTHRLRELDLLSDWQYRSTCMTLSERGFRSSEPGGLIPETSQLLLKVLYRSSSRITLGSIAAELALDSSELRQFVMRLVPVGAN